MVRKAIGRVECAGHAIPFAPETILVRLADSTHSTDLRHFPKYKAIPLTLRTNFAGKCKIMLFRPRRQRR
jgi:hypothetical protein